MGNSNSSNNENSWIAVSPNDGVLPTNDSIQTAFDRRLNMQCKPLANVSLTSTPIMNTPTISESSIQNVDQMRIQSHLTELIQRARALRRRPNDSSANIGPIHYSPNSCQNTNLLPLYHSNMQDNSNFHMRGGGNINHLVQSTVVDGQYVALHDYVKRVDDDLSMTKGQIFNILDNSHSHWWYAECVSTGCRGYVPKNHLALVKSLESNEWYFGTLKRIEAEHYLQLLGNDHGSFLVRVSESQSSDYSLSVREENTIKHYRIRSRYSRTNPSLKRFYISKQLPFVSIQQLVNHYLENQSGLCCRLDKPCIKPTHPEPIGLSHKLIDKWEIPKSSIILKEKIGQGQFGEVFKAIWNKTTIVAVKTLKPTADICAKPNVGPYLVGLIEIHVHLVHVEHCAARSPWHDYKLVTTIVTLGSCDAADFLREAQTMKRLHHPNLIQLYAVCTQSEPFYIVTEFMTKGSLLNYLQSTEGRGLNISCLIMMAAKIASGMAYLESRRHIHRDLAARNVLVGEQRVVKIADFGLARMIHNREYVAHAGARFPIKWTSPEAANYSRFTIKSDVWSFGILLTEIVTYGRSPYPGMHNAEVLRQVDAGYRMSKPPGCPPEIYDLMIECWAADENQRPSFAMIHTRLEQYCEEERPAYKNANGESAIHALQSSNNHSMPMSNQQHDAFSNHLEISVSP